MKSFKINLSQTNKCKRPLSEERKEKPFWGIVDLTLNYDTTTIHIKMIDNNDDYVAQSFSNIDCYEPFFIYNWCFFCKSTQGSILDIGASTGLYSLLSNAIVRSRQVHAFEPFSRAYSRLISNKDLNLFPKIKIHPVALSNTEEVTTFNIKNFEGPITTSGKLRTQETQEAEILSITKLQVQTKKISSIIPISEKIGLIKIDVEGHELAVLETMEDMIRTWRPVVFFECLEENLFERLIGYFFKFSYIIYSIDEELKQLIETDKYEDKMMNFIALPVKLEEYKM